MALTPQNNEAFLREVDDELRREQAATLWRRYGLIAVVALVAALAALAAYLFWNHRQTRAAEKEGEQLQAAFDALGADDAAAASKPLAALAGSSREGYRALARFTQADIQLQKNDLKGAATTFATVANDQSVAAPFRNLALIRQTTAEFDTLAPQVVVQRMTPLAVAGNPWLGSAGELLAVAQLRLGQRDQAARTFARVATDETVPQSIRQRAVQMADVVGSGVGVAGVQDKAKR